MKTSNPGICCVCNSVLDFGNGLIELGKRACTKCLGHAMSVRRQRWESSHEATNDIYARLRGELLRLSDELKSGRKELAALKADRESVIASYRDEAICHEYMRLIRMSFWRRLRMLFGTYPKGA